MKTIGEYKLSKFLGKGSYGEIYLNTFNQISYL